jgi:hypothetical protein
MKMPSSIKWMSWWIHHPEHVEPCCRPNAWGACVDTCPRVHPEHAPKSMLAEFVSAPNCGSCDGAGRGISQGRDGVITEPYCPSCNGSGKVLPS